MPKKSFFRTIILYSIALLIALALLLLRTAFAQANSSLRFYGTGRDGIDRVVIPLDSPQRAIDIGADFTIEFWLKALPGENAAAPCVPGGDNWINGNVIVDRDVYFAGDYGDYGISLGAGRVAFGVNNGAEGTTICGVTDIADGQWHHLALTRSAADGSLAIFVDGRRDAQGPGPRGDISYRDGRPTEYPNDPFLVIGAEKHDAGPEYPSFSGWIDEFHVSQVVRYTSDFTRPSAPFIPDANTVALYHFDEGAGNLARDSSSAAAEAQLRIGGNPSGPAWSNDTPWANAPAATETPAPAATDTPASAPAASDTPAPAATGAPMPDLPSPVATTVAISDPSPSPTNNASDVAATIPPPAAAAPTVIPVTPASGASADSASSGIFVPYWAVAAIIGLLVVIGIGVALARQRK